MIPDGLIDSLPTLLAVKHLPVGKSYYAARAFRGALKV
jgi:hypothetical protein